MSIDFDTVTDVAAELFGRGLEEGLPPAEFFDAWNKVLGAVLHWHAGRDRRVRRWPALGRWEAAIGCLPKSSDRPKIIH